MKQELNKYSKEAGTCYGKDNESFFYGFLNQFQDSFCYTFVLQFITVLLMYVNVGKGKYWKILFYASLAGFLGALVENLSVAYICREEAKNEKNVPMIPFFVNEIFWIPNEYAIPLLNLIKMEAFSEGNIGIITKYIIIFLSIPYIIFRGFIGYYRMKVGFLQNETIHLFHGYAFGVMAAADIICTVVLLYLIRINNSKIAMSGSNINEFVKHSSYTILIAVDIVCALLSICNILSNIECLEHIFTAKLFTPFHCLKCSSILILAIDAFIFKYGANMSSANNSTGKLYANDSYNVFCGNSNLNLSMNSTTKSKPTNINMEMSNNTSNNTLNNSNNTLHNTSTSNINQSNNNPNNISINNISNIRSNVSDISDISNYNTTYNQFNNSNINNNNSVVSFTPYNYSPIERSNVSNSRLLNDNNRKYE